MRPLTVEMVMLSASIVNRLSGGVKNPAAALLARGERFWPFHVYGFAVENLTNDNLTLVLTNSRIQAVYDKDTRLYLFGTFDVWVAAMESFGACEDNGQLYQLACSVYHELHKLGIEIPLITRPTYGGGFTLHARPNRGKT